MKTKRPQSRLAAELDCVRTLATIVFVVDINDFEKASICPQVWDLKQQAAPI